MKTIFRNVVLSLGLSLGLWAESNLALNLSLGSLDIEYKPASLISVELLGGYPLGSSMTSGSTTVASSHYSLGARVNLFTADALTSDWWLAPRLYASGFYRYHLFDITSPDVTSKAMTQLGAIVGVRTILFGSAHLDLGVGMATVDGSYLTYLSDNGMIFGSLIQTMFYSIPIDVRFGWAF